MEPLPTGAALGGEEEGMPPRNSGHLKELLPGCACEQAGYQVLFPVLEACLFLKKHMPLQHHSLKVGGIRQPIWLSEREVPSLEFWSCSRGIISSLDRELHKQIE